MSKFEISKMNVVLMFMLLGSQAFPENLIPPPHIKCDLNAYVRGPNGVSVPGTSVEKEVELSLKNSNNETLRQFQFRIKLGRHSSTIAGWHNVFHVDASLNHGEVETVAMGSAISAEPTDPIIRDVLFHHLRVGDEMAMIQCYRVN